MPTRPNTPVKEIFDVEIAESKPRPKWDKGVEFLMSCISLSVGLGNIWRYFKLDHALSHPYLLKIYFVYKISLHLLQERRRGLLNSISLNSVYHWKTVLLPGDDSRSVHVKRFDESHRSCSTYERRRLGTTICFSIYRDLLQRNHRTHSCLRHKVDRLSSSMVNV